MKKIDIHYQRTFKQPLLFILIIMFHACSSPPKRHEIVEPVPVTAEDIRTVKNLPQSHKTFLARFLPEIHTANNNILILRNKVLDLKDTLKDGDGLSESQLHEINNFLKKYRLDLLTVNPMPSSEDIEGTISKLLKRLDIIPVQLVMAQAIIESGWGSSGFAREGNNYFGVHCYTEGCGVKPAGDESANFYVKTYPSEMAGLEDYLWILNTGHAYQWFTKYKTRTEE